MKDPFVILRGELVEAAERAALPAPRKRWGWLRRPSRPVAILLVALVITGSAAAAVLSLTGSASQPVMGRVPGAITSASLAGYGYTISVSPSLAAGTAGWQPWIVYSRTGSSGYGQMGGGVWYPAATDPVFGGGSAPVAASPASRAATPSSTSLPAHRCGPSGLGAGRSAPSVHARCRRAIEPPCSSFRPKDPCSSSPPTDPSRSVSIRRG